MTTTPDTASSRAEATIEDLEQEGDVAADFLEGLLDIADIDGDLALDVRNGRAYVSIEQDGGEGAADLGALADPTTVQALQELLNANGMSALVVTEKKRRPDRPWTLAMIGTLN